MKPRLAALLAITLLTLTGCGEKAAPPAETTPPPSDQAGPPMPPAPTETTTEAATDAAGLYAQRCASCHGKTAEGVGDFPSLAKLDRATVDARLRAYRAGETVGPKTAVMAPMAKPLSDQQITDLASYLGS